MRTAILMHLHHGIVNEGRIGILKLLGGRREVMRIAREEIIGGTSRGGRGVGVQRGTGGIGTMWRDERGCGIWRETCTGGERLNRFCWEIYKGAATS